jgi:stress response protein YsnF
VYVGLTKDQIKNAPKFDESTYRDDAYRSSVGDYYGGYESHNDR